MGHFKFKNQKIKIRGDVDKPTGYIFYTCTFKNGDRVVLSRLDGNILKFTNFIGKNEILNLDEFIEAVDIFLSQ